jgi:hypothetical protein
MFVFLCTGWMPMTHFFARQDNGGRWSPRSRLYWVCLLFGLWILVLGPSCNCDSESIGTGLVLDVKLSQPAAGLVSGDVPVTITVTNSSTDQPAGGDVQLIQLFLTPQGTNSRGERQIAELHTSPYSFKWNSIQEADGFYLLKAVVYDAYGGTHESRRVLVQVVNSPPDIWFVNCYDGQFVRGTYSLVVSLKDSASDLKAPPTLSINGVAGPKTEDKRAPFRFQIDTKTFKEGDFVTFAVEAEDFRGNVRRIVCRPRVDNVLPTVRFINPTRDGVLLGRKFPVEFQAFDAFGVREVRLWVDGSACPQDASKPDASCEKTKAWIGTAAPNYPITVELPAAYKSEQTILLTARAVDQAGNVSEPPARIRVRIDPVAPEIFIRSPGKGALVETAVKFVARITDNDLLRRVTFKIEGAPNDPVILSKSPNTSEVTLEVSEPDPIKTYGRGRRYLVVTAEDLSGNITETRQLFNVGCSNTADCPIGRVCYDFKCVVPAKIGESCSAAKPCELQSACVPGKAPLCSESKETFCRLRCHPGNKVVAPDACPSGFYCDRGTQTCMPSDLCAPFRNLCKSDEQCVPVDDDSSFCLPIGNVKPGGSCEEDCNPDKNCGRGFWCVYNLNAGGYGCMLACEVDNPKCPQGQICQALRWSFGGAPLRYGVCVSQGGP